MADFNLLNYFVTLDQSGNKCGPANLGCRGADTQAEFDKQVAKLVPALLGLNADVIGLQELENPKTGVPFTQWAVSDLANRMNAADTNNTCAGNYVAVNPGNAPLGTDAIQNGLIYCDATVEFKAVDVLDDSDLPLAGVSAPVFVGPNTNRVVIGAKLMEKVSGQNTEFTVVVTHQKSKGSRNRTFNNNCKANPASNPNCDQGNGAGYWNEMRTNGSKAIRAWLNGNTTIGTANELIIGDVNGYTKETPVTDFTTNGYTDLKTDRQGKDSYVFDGRWGSLDRGLANAGMNGLVTGADAWTINAEEPRAFDWDENFKGEGNNQKPAALAAYFKADEFRSSDHSPMLIGLNFGGSATPAPALGGFGLLGLGAGLLGIAGLRRRRN